MDFAYNFRQAAFVVGFITFLAYCIDYPKLPKEHSMKDVLIPKCTTKYVDMSMNNTIIWLTV